LKKAANIAAGSKEPNKRKVGKVTRKQVMDIVKTKAKDLNARSDEAAFRIIEGTARQNGPRNRRLIIRLRPQCADPAGNEVVNSGGNNAEDKAKHAVKNGHKDSESEHHRGDKRCWRTARILSLLCLLSKSTGQPSQAKMGRKN